uniref:Uncharacterized protein n=1 Tax=Aegilops tauschii subsp. strangulata TaxID=200361 RepID=A0A453JGL5_AEGTS
MEIKQLEDDNFVEKRISDLKQQAAEAFKKQDYLNASVFYTQALKMDNFDAKLLSNRSLCWLRMGDGERSYDDATECKKLQPMWAKAYYRQGAAQILMEEVKRLRNYSWRLLWWKWYDQPCMPTAERSFLFL